MDDLVRAVRHLDGDVAAVRAGVDTVLADGGALQAALTLTAGLRGHLQNALLGNGVRCGSVGLGGDIVDMGMTDDDLGEARGVGDALNDGRGTAVRVACAVNAGNVGLECGSLLAHLDAVGGHEVGIDLLADSGDHEIAGDGELFTALNGAAATGGVRLAENHPVAKEHALSLLDRSGELHELNTLVDGELKLVLIGGHELLGAAVEDGGVRAHALGNAGGVHRGVARADDNNVALQAGLDLLFHLLHPLDDALDIAFYVELAGLPGAGRHENMGVAHLLERFDGGSGLAELDLDAVLHHQCDILVDGFVRDAEGGDDITGHAAELALALEDRDVNAFTAEEVSGRDTGRTAADDGDLLALDTRGLPDGSHKGVVAVFGGNELGVADADGLVVEVARALALAAVRADGAGDERQGVLFGDELERGTVQSLAAQLNVLRDILGDGAAALARRDKAVDPGDLLLALAGGDGLDGLYMVEVVQRGGGKVGDGGGIIAGECLVGHILDLLDHLIEAVVATGLEDRGGAGDRPNTGSKELVAVEVIGAAGEGNAHLAIELAGNAAAHLNGQREEAAAGHVHLVVGQLAAGGVDGEGVGELETEGKTELVGELLQALEHGDGILPLEILVEVMLVKDDVVIPHAVEDAARGLVAEDGRIALDKSVQVLFLQEVGGDALDLLRRAAVERGDGHAAGNVGGDGGDKVLLLGEHFGEDLLALLELGRLARVLHVLNIGVDLPALDAFQIVADGHVEHEPVGIAEAVDLGEDLERAPGLDVLVLRLLDGQLRGPLLVVAFVSGENAGTGHTGGKLRAVHLLYGLDFKEAGAGDIGGDDVLRELAVGTGCGTERRFNALAENGQALAVGFVLLVDTEDIAALDVFGDHPVHQRLKGNGVHFFRHGKFSFLCNET